VANEPIEAQESLEVLFDRALALHARGADESAKTAYLAVLFRDTTHLGALINLGTLLHTTGYRTAARTSKPSPSIRAT
jgi:hypothetical protein